MKAVLTLLLSTLLVASAASEADARSRHERVSVTPMKEGGKTVGFRLKLTLRPTDYGHDRVRIGVAPKGKSAGGDYRDHASGKKKGFLLHQFKEISGLKTNQAKDVTLDLRYSDAAKVKPGSEIEIVSAWSDSSKQYWHVWGLKTNISGPVESFKLPNGTAVARPKKPASRTRTAAKPKKPAAKPKKSAARTAARPKKPASATRGLSSSTRRARASSPGRSRSSASSTTRAKPKKPRTTGARTK